MKLPPGLIDQWRTAQQTLRRRFRSAPLGADLRIIGGADCAFSADRTTIFAVALLWDRLDRRIIDRSLVRMPVTTPYVPGYLSFREGPALRQAIEQLRRRPEVMLFDGQGYAHPRRCGLATHLGVELALPSVGVAKSVLVGDFDMPAAARGSRSPMTDAGEVVAMALRTRDRVRPVYVSVGHRADLESACELVLACCTRYRIPEPTRLADAEVERAKRGN